MISLCAARVGIFANLPVFWTLPSTSSGAQAAAGTAVINSIGPLADHQYDPIAMMPSRANRKVDLRKLNSNLEDSGLKAIKYPVVGTELFTSRIGPGDETRAPGGTDAQIVKRIEACSTVGRREQLSWADANARSTDKPGGQPIHPDAGAVSQHLLRGRLCHRSRLLADRRYDVGDIFPTG